MKDRGCARFNSPLFSAGLEFGYFRTKEQLGPSPDASRHPLPQGEGLEIGHLSRDRHSCLS